MSLVTGRTHIIHTPTVTSSREPTKARRSSAAFRRTNRARSIDSTYRLPSADKNHKQTDITSQGIN